jgi:hypothetical protein
MVIETKWVKRVGHVACMGKMGDVFTILDRKPEDKKPFC